MAKFAGSSIPVSDISPAPGDVRRWSAPEGRPDILMRCTECVLMARRHPDICCHPSSVCCGGTGPPRASPWRLELNEPERTFWARFPRV